MVFTVLLLICWHTLFAVANVVDIFVSPHAIDGPINTNLCNSASADTCTLRSAVALCLSFLNTTDDVCSVYLPAATVEIDPDEGEVDLNFGSSSHTAIGTLRIVGDAATIVQPNSLSTAACRVFGYRGESSSNVPSITDLSKTLNFQFSNFSVAFFGNETFRGGAISLVNYNYGSVGRGTATFEAIIFRNNSAYIGGAVLVHNSRDVVFSSCSFVSNNATEEGGGMYIEADNLMINVSHCTFADNQAGSGKQESSAAAVSGTGAFRGLGGGLCVEQRNKHITISDSVFHANRGLRGGGLGLYHSNLHVAVERTLFDMNFGFRGGGIYLGSQNHNFTLRDCSLQNNQASEDGGGLRLFSSNEYMVVAGCDFAGNRAVYGGAVSLNDKNHHMRVTESAFQSNSARTFGGAVYLFDNNVWCVFLNSSFLFNLAVDGQGAGLSAYKDNHDAQFLGCVFRGNEAKVAGALSMYGNNRRMYFEETLFEANVATGDAAGVFIDNDNWYVAFLSCRFISNRAGDEGGGVYLFSKVVHTVYI